MDDTADNKQAGSSLETTLLQQSKEILRESKPSEDISINSKTKNLIIEEKKPEIITSKGPANTETVFQKLDINDKSNSSSDSAVTDEAENDKIKTPENKVPADSATDIKEHPSDRNRSDIFSLDDKIKAEDTIFSINGTPSGKINRRREEHSEVFPVGCMGCKEGKDDNPVNVPQMAPVGSKTLISSVKESLSRPVSGRFSRHRNPLTGAGVDSTDEMKKKENNGRRRVDGNPVLGLGYDSPTGVTPSATRVPPGGYSKGLW